MQPTIAVISVGAMGSGVGARLVSRGAKVVTLLEGRSAASMARAEQAKMENVNADGIAAADMILSIVPPGEAAALAERLQAPLEAATRKPAYIDCNAVNPQTAEAIGKIVAGTGCPFIDGGIIGGPPRADYDGPTFYLSGEESRRALFLSDLGLRLRFLDAPIGAASALKMAYGGITKGLVAIGAAMALGAERAGVAAALRQELLASRPDLTGFLDRAAPDMFAKAYRFVAEMEEVSRFLGARPESDIFAGMAGLYDRLSSDTPQARAEIMALADFFRKG